MTVCTFESLATDARELRDWANGVLLAAEAKDHVALRAAASDKLWATNPSSIRENALALLEEDARATLNGLMDRANEEERAILRAGLMWIEEEKR